MKKMTVIWILLILILTLVLTIIGLNVIKRNKPYKALEADIVEAMKIYYGQDSNLKKLPHQNKEVKITIAELRDFGLEINTNLKNDTCIGYGIVKGKNVSHSYQAFIKCNNYKK